MIFKHDNKKYMYIHFFKAISLLSQAIQRIYGKIIALAVKAFTIVQLLARKGQEEERELALHNS
jgi:hypothetical protein